MDIRVSRRRVRSKRTDESGALPVENVNAGRRNFFKGLSTVGVSATATFLLGDFGKLEAQTTSANLDTANQIFTAAMIAEDLATTFYYNGLIGPVIQDADLAGPGGTALSPTTTGQSVANVAYLRAALGQEIAHANLLRAVANLGASAATDPYQTFYFPADSFNSRDTFTATLEALENAFIGAYLIAIRELTMLAARSATRGVPAGAFGSSQYSADQLAYFAEVAGSILGVECEHRVFAREIGQRSPTANNWNFEQTDGLTSVYNGSQSAVVALTPFLTPSTGPGYSLATALAAATQLIVTSTTGNNPPPQ